MGAPRIAIWKFASCDGCQLSLLDCEEALLELAGAVRISHFLEASSRVEAGPYDLSLVEGSITTAQDAVRIREIRAASARLVTIGACATAGGIQALRDTRDLDALKRSVYPDPALIEVLERSTPVSDHVAVDAELRGCPVSRRDLLELVAASLAGRRPDLPDVAQCAECKRAGTVCVMVATGTPCLGPVTRAGCGNLCPRIGRGCYGCFGPVEGANCAAMSAQLRDLGMTAGEIMALYRGFNAGAQPFAEEAARHE
ncbi:coenzyme F420-reducing hydrogenase gamma subunit [Aliiruegeria haliotis]|uniref:Coenzyme F420-reducing hydrogenase gamma subunit n=1 Tax=Aliiruegeria haliotis TaxID=1280846 RepID=A0A2T0S0D0_9RHOB|nr:oxidoreductase [Aliiruegeria haliotis]PRY26887.1 coenzyme F420-reducing hydrogenase gamma subunit [Aliiruegeria haliotis]